MPWVIEIDSINKRYFREIAKCRRQFPTMHDFRNERISVLRQRRVRELRALGLRVSL